MQGFLFPSSCELGPFNVLSKHATPDITEMHQMFKDIYVAIIVPIWNTY